MVKRVIMRAQLKQPFLEQGLEAIRQSAEAQQLVQDGMLMTAAAFHWQRNVFLYYECLGTEPGPADLLPSLIEPWLELWPGQAAPRRWIPMIDVFHFNEPASAGHWRRKEPAERRVGRVAHLKPEMTASYIYYHYQLQEEQAFHGPKYEIIAMHENLLFGYQEFPAVVEPPVVPKKLATSGTPANWNDSRMDLHFQPWEDGHLYFKPVETLFSYYKQ
ncbi:hypothetical protein [Paenibacillus protaetiae]|uniref:Uncharacterized protein n=1 Tax=Paenibacillus protaetiae TaxID=2509456 RepID=A0A4P6EX63_9BACL|nr:hypothetical protein [Paenibacillus protaetiae]QAY67644.1 hypothetical protein ET464_15895 [Paenibacillus protaetiae]